MEFRPGISPGERVRCRRLRNLVWSQNIRLGREVGSKRVSGMLLAYERPLCATPSKGITEFCGTEGARPSGAAGNTNHKGYSRPVVSGSSVNVIANPVRVAPTPKVIAHVPTNIIITASGVGL
jgi:hypothetical protein